MARTDLNIICRREECEHALYEHCWRTAKYSRHHEVGVCKGDNGNCKCLGYVICTTNAVGPALDRKEEGSSNMGTTVYKTYRRTNIAEMTRWYAETDMTDVSISEADKRNGSPKLGDMIARNPANHDDRWLVAEDYFLANFEEINDN